MLEAAVEAATRHRRKQYRKFGVFIGAPSLLWAPFDNSESVSICLRFGGRGVLRLSTRRKATRPIKVYNCLDTHEQTHDQCQKEKRTGREREKKEGMRESLGQVHRIQPLAETELAG